jgi:hypothetical protein
LSVAEHDEKKGITMSPESKHSVTAAEFDRKFSAGEDMSEHVDWSNAIKRVSLDLPLWVIKELDKESERRGITRQSLIKTWIVDRLDAVKLATHAV